MADQLVKKQLLKEIMQTDFVLKELNLFLDTHPTNKEALNMFKVYEKKANNLKNEYAKIFSSLTPSVNNNIDSWEWIEDPWPWENC